MKGEETVQHQLLIHEAEKNVQAEYACHAINVGGEAWCFADVVIQLSSGYLSSLVHVSQSFFTSPMVVHCRMHVFVIA